MRFQDHQEDVEDDSRSGRPFTLKVKENIEKLGNLVRSDSIHAIAGSTGIDKECTR